MSEIIHFPGKAPKKRDEDAAHTKVNRRVADSLLSRGTPKSVLEADDQYVADHWELIQKVEVAAYALESEVYSLPGFNADAARLQRIRVKNVLFKELLNYIMYRSDTAVRDEPNYYAAVLAEFHVRMTRYVITSGGTQSLRKHQATYRSVKDILASARPLVPALPAPANDQLFVHRALKRDFDFVRSELFRRARSVLKSVITEFAERSGRERNTFTPQEASEIEGYRGKLSREPLEMLVGRVLNERAADIDEAWDKLFPYYFALYFYTTWRIKYIEDVLREPPQG